MLVRRRFVGTVHLFQGPSKSSPVSLYARKEFFDFRFIRVLELINRHWCPWALFEVNAGIESTSR